METLKKILARLAALGSAAAGIGLLAFTGGFLARKAQHDFAQLPFVFVDYRAYIEMGLMGGLESLNLFLGHWQLIVLMCGITIGSILLLELPWFKALVQRAHWNFLGYVLLVLAVGGLLYQEFHVARTLRANKMALQSSPSTPVASTVPAIGFFDWEWVTPPPLDPPDPRDFDLQILAESGWENLVEELEAELSVRQNYLELRPRPIWVAPPIDRDPSRPAILGERVDEERLEEKRARTLYGWIFSIYLVCVWATVFLGAWRHQVRQSLDNSGQTSPPGKTGFLGNLLGRLREELWYSSKMVLRPIALVLLLACLTLLPECYGLLAMPRLSQEWVELVPRSEIAGANGASDPAERDIATKRSISEEARKVIHDRVRSHLETWAFAEEETKIQMLEELVGDIVRLERSFDPKDAEFIDSARRTASIIAPDLMKDGFLDPSKPSGVGGYILHYSRSDESNLLLIRRGSDEDARWDLEIKKIDKTAEIRVTDPDKTPGFLASIRNLPKLSPTSTQARLAILLDMGHPRTLEAFMVAAFERSPRIAGIATTKIGQLASALPETAGGRYRRLRASKVLLSRLEDRALMHDIRGASATALYLSAPQGDSHVCSELLRLFQLDSEELRDPYWALRGAISTSLAKLRCENLRKTILKAMESKQVGYEKVPDEVFATFPSLLLELGKDEGSILAIGQVLADPDSNAEVLGTAVSALGGLGYLDPDSAVLALGTFIRVRADELQAKKDSPVLQLAAIDALRQIGSPGSRIYFEELIDSGATDDEKERGALGLAELGSPEAKDTLLRVAEDEQQSVPVRLLAITGLGSVADLEAMRRLESLFETKIANPAPENLVLCEAIHNAFGQLGRDGNSFAGHIAKEMGSELSLAAARVHFGDDDMPEGLASLLSQMGDGQSGDELDSSSLEGLSLETLQRGSLDEFLLFMGNHYYEPEVFANRIEPLFPAFDLAAAKVEFADAVAMMSLAGGTEEQIEQDLLARWVFDNRASLEWDPEAGVYHSGSS